MRLPPAWYGMRDTLAGSFPLLSGSQLRTAAARSPSPGRSGRAQRRWERTRRRAAGRVAKPWLVLALARLWAVAAGTVAAAAARQQAPPRGVRRPATPPPPRTGQRQVRVFPRGEAIVRRRLGRGQAVTPRWLAQAAWPAPAGPAHQLCG